MLKEQGSDYMKQLIQNWEEEETQKHLKNLEEMQRLRQEDSHMSDDI